MSLITYKNDNNIKFSSEEEIVDAWFKELCGNIAKDEGVATSDTPMGAGYINTKKISEDKLFGWTLPTRPLLAVSTHLPLRNVTEKITNTKLWTLCCRKNNSTRD